MEKDQQEVMFKLQMFEQQIKGLQQQLQAVSQGIVEMQSLCRGLDLINGSEGKEIMAQIGRGIFVKAKILSDNLTVDIGEGNFVKKNVSETKAMIDKQILKLEDVKTELEENMEKVGEALTQTMHGAQQNQSHCVCGDNAECPGDCGDNSECEDESVREILSEKSSSKSKKLDEMFEEDKE